MKICLFRAFPDPFRKSMQIYADQLRARVAELLCEDEQVVDCLPSRVSLRPKLKRYWDQYFGYQRFARHCHGDVNHIVDHGYGHLVASLPDGTAVVTFHDATVAKLTGVALTTRLSLRYSLGAMRRAARIVTDSYASRTDLLKIFDYPEDRITVIYPGIDQAFRDSGDRDQLRTSLGLPARYLLHVGHNLPYMNLDQVIRVFARLVANGADLTLVKVGAEFNESQHRELQALGVSDRVVHLGMVPFAQLPAIYRCAEILLYPVLNAGFGLPPLEAMACGVPVVSSDRGALPEVLGDAPLYADPDDTVGNSDAVARLLADSTLYEQQRRRGLERAQRYSWEQTAREMLSLYRSIGNA